MSQKPFHFKQFSIKQDQTAMKIGTDGVLLGAWVITNNAKNILDVGCGTGLISLMLAQKSEAEITAVEIDKSATGQALENFKNSPWSDRLKQYNNSFQDFATQKQPKYDLIVSNPPFFEAQKNNSSRNTARSQTELSFNELIEGSKKLLNKSGRLALIIPINSLGTILEIAKKQELLPNRVCKVKGNSNSPVKRVMLELDFKSKELIETELCIEGEKRHDYTAEYRELLKDYLTIF